jgi:hypothetical protein
VGSFEEGEDELEPTKQQCNSGFAAFSAADRHADFRGGPEKKHFLCACAE